ncbi:MAG: MBOAT family protein, partial [Parabacteroides sp.]|nr:MBOAT family protein [Parabacteroides sp.]
MLGIESFFNNLSFEKFGNLFLYHSDEPMLFSSGLFFFLFVGFLIVYMSLKRHLLTRIIYVTLFSLYFYYKSSGLFFILLVFVATSDFLIALAMSQLKSKTKQKWMIVLSLCIDLGLLGYFKYFNFLRDIVASLGHEIGYLTGNAWLQHLTYQHLD